ncbi:Anthrax toxin receptor-like [Lemmus lemmus]
MSKVICRFTFSDSRIIDESPSDINDKSISCPGPVIHHAGEKVSLQVSLNSGISFIGNKLIITSTNCESTRVRAQGFLLVSLLLLCCCWKLCCRKVKSSAHPCPLDPEENLSPPPTSPPAPLVLFPSSPSPVNPNPTVILACCGCGNRGIQGNLDTCCSCFHPGYHQVPLMWCHPKVQGRCTNIAIMSPSCSHAPCSPKLCLPSTRDCLHHTKPSCSSRIFVQPSRECMGIPQASCSPKICLKAGQECLPITPTLCSKVCPSQKYYILDSYPSRCTSPSRMLPLLPPHTRQSVESLCQTYPCRPFSK